MRKFRLSFATLAFFGLSMGAANAQNVCSIGTNNYPTLDAALAAVPDYTQTTIKLLTDITTNNGIYIDKKIITFDLNGKKLNVNPPSPSQYGLTFSYGGGQVKLLNPANGELNINGGAGLSTSGINCFAEVTNVTVTDHDAIDNSTGGTINVYGNITVSSSKTGPYYNYGIFAVDSVTVHGNISVSGAYTCGVLAGGGGKVIVDGVITATNGAKYVNIQYNYLTQSQFTVPTTKPGYLTYTNGTSTIWVKDPAYVPVCEITAGGITTQYTLEDALAYVQSNQTIKLLQDIDYNNIINISGKTVIFDLNGKKLTAQALNIGTNGHQSLLNPANGEFNININGTVSGISSGVMLGSSGWAAVTNVTATGGKNGVEADFASNDLTVFGNIRITSSAGSFGAVVSGGARITVEGKITNSGGAGFVKCGATVLTNSQYTTSTTKVGYLTYSDGVSTVWVGNKIIVYEITATAGAGGSINPSGNISVDAGDDKTFTFTANSGYQIDQVLIDDTNNPTAVSAGSYTFTNVSENHKIEVYFKPITGIVEMQLIASLPRIYPNPTNGQLRVSGDILDGKDREIIIFDVVGQVVFTSHLSNLSPEITIDISHLSVGLYFLKVGGKMVKIVKE